ncbi:uncharacterized protein VP01_8095g1, partial [Puccinia sorghi]
MRDRCRLVAVLQVHLLPLAVIRQRRSPPDFLHGCFSMGLILPGRPTGQMPHSPSTINALPGNMSSGARDPLHWKSTMFPKHAKIAGLET